jgi:hypothetical protein
MRHIDDAGVELAHDIEHTFSRLIEIPPARIPCIGKQFVLGGTASRSDNLESKIVPREEQIGGDPCDRETHLIC